MPPRVDRQTHHFPDGSDLELTIRTSDPAIYRIFTADLARRLRSARRSFVSGASLTEFGTVARASGRDVRQSTTTHGLPDGEVTVSIDAGGTASHEYLRFLVRGAVAYTRLLHVEGERASPVAVLLLGSGLALVAFGWWIPGVPLLGAGGVVALHLAVYWLSARGTIPSLSRIPDPGKPPR